MPIAKLRPAFTFTEDRLAELRAVVPEAFADGAVNWEALREALGAYLEDEGRDAEHFGLTWPGKREARRLAAQPSKGTLIPAPGEGVDEASTRNLFIEGDNLEVLKLLQKSYAGRVKLIYIDPPYNTGHDFVYKDNFSEPLATYLKATGQADEMGQLLVANPKISGRFHANWLNLIFPRLLLAKTLLSDDGVIFVSIDDNELHNLRHVMNEIFGEGNFIGVMKRRAARKTAFLSGTMSDMCDYVVAYSKNELSAPLAIGKVADSTRPVFNQGNNVTERFIPAGTEARCEDGLYKSGLYKAKSLEFQFLDNLQVTRGKVVHKVRVRGPFRVNQDILSKTVYVTKNVALRRYLLPDEMEKAKTISDLVDEPTFYNEMGGEELELLMGEAGLFSNPKPFQLIKYLIMTLSSNDRDRNFVVLDFFAGSATTAQAVYAANHDDNGNRSYICVQVPDFKHHSKYTSLAEIGKERIRRVIKRMRQEAKRKLDLEDRATPEDLGFRVYKLGRSNYKAWQDYHGDSVEALETLFDRIETPLVDNWKPEHVLSEVLLLQGFPLDSTVTAEASFKHNHIQRVASDAIGHRLFVCLDGQITDATIGQLMLAPEDVFVCLDSALTDEAKLRLADRCTLRVI